MADVLQTAGRRVKIKKTIFSDFFNGLKLGNFSKAVSGALTEAEKKNEELKREVESLEYQKENTFKAPPKEWINHRLDRLGETLNKDTVLSALALKELLSPIILEPVLNKEADLYRLLEGEEKHFKPYYIAHTKIQTLALLDDERKGSNWYGWRTQSEPIRTAAELKVKILLPPLLNVALSSKMRENPVFGSLHDDVS